LLRGPLIEREGDLEEEEEIFEELMQCPGLSNAYIKFILGRRYKHQLKKKARLQITKI
jgi:hypothetical protein